VRKTKYTSWKPPTLSTCLNKQAPDHFERASPDKTDIQMMH